MAAEAITGMAENTALVGTDLIEMVNDLGGTPDNVKVELDTLRSHITGRYVEHYEDAGDITTNSAAWANVDTGLDLVIAAAVDDLLRVEINGRVSAEAFFNYFDVVSIVSAAPVNAWGNGAAEDADHNGIVGWAVPNGLAGPLVGSRTKAIVSGDIDSGNVTLRLRFKQPFGNGDKIIKASADDPLWWCVWNLGPAL